MSCQINPVGNICDIHEIRRFLFLTDDGKDLGNESWIQKCLVSVCPIADIIVIGKGKKLVISTSKWDSTTSSNLFQITYSGTIHEDDNITSILCIPIVRQSKSSNIQPDWTCILIGFESGYVRAYLETSELIYEEQYHNEQVVSLKCRSQHGTRPDIALIMRSEEVYVLYETILCVLQGKEFISILRNSRSQLARAQAKSELIDYNQPSLEIKKWEFQDQSVIKDIAVVGLSMSNTFDNLLAVSTCDGFDTSFRSVPPNHTLVLAVGFKPFLGFHFGTEGTNRPILVDVAKIVADKLKSALPSWLTGSGQSEKTTSMADHFAEPMGCRFGLCDLNRAGNSIILNSNHNLAAISDSLGRVIIVDTKKGIALKILKGYREAQCSFIQVADDRYSNPKIEKKIALFLVIYSPKKGTIEIFTTQQFLKVATFTASKHSRLLYINHSMMGFSQPTKSKYACQFTTVLIDDDGMIKEIVIPFHFALNNEENSKKARDIHLYRKLRSIVRCDDPNNDIIKTETLNTVKELQTVDMKIQLIEMLLKSKNVPTDVLLESITSTLDNLKESSDEEVVNSFIIRAKNIISFLHFYDYMKSKEEKTEETSSIIKLADKEIEHLKDLLEVIVPQEPRPKVKFADENSVSIIDYLSIFNLNVDSKITLMPKYDENIVFSLCKDLFNRHDKKCKNLEKFRKEIIKSNINPKDLFLLLIMYWVNQPFSSYSDLENEINNLTNILYILIKIFTDSNSKISLKYYWEDIREVIFNSTEPISALSAAISCRYIAFRIEREQNSEEAVLEDDFEIWSRENCDWTLLIGKLEDVAVLNLIVVKKPIINKFSSLPKLTHDELDISLKIILQKRGSVSELVARWLTISGIDAEMIVFNEALKERRSKGPISNEYELDVICSKDKRDFIDTERLFRDFNMMKIHWPYSLDSGMILANMSWEYALVWKKDLQRMDCLEACIACVKAIPNFFVKLGLFNLIWKTHLKLLFESTINLINKVGKVPKMKLCTQDTGLSDVEIPIFMKICTEYLNTFTDLVQEMYNVPKTPLKFEPLWENGGQPLAELAIQQTNINFELLLAHYELSSSFSMLCQFPVKAYKPMKNLFHPDVIQTFFCDFQEKPEVDFSRTDVSLTAARMQFLKKMISSSVAAIPIKNDEPYYKDHRYWMSKCKLLGTIWKLDLDVIRMQEILQFFIHGHDDYAHDLIPTIEDKKTLGRELVLVVGYRMNNLMEKSMSNLVEYSTICTFLTPPVTSWLEKIKKETCADSTLREMLRIMRLTLNFLEEKTYEYRLANMFFEGIEQLIPRFEN